MEKMVALKAKKKKDGVCPSSWIMPFLFVVKIEIANILANTQTISDKEYWGEKRKKNGLKLGKKVFGNTVVFSGSFSPSKCLMLRSNLHCGLCGETTFLSYSMVIQGGELWE